MSIDFGPRERVRYGQFHDGIEQAQIFEVEGVTFDFTALAGLVLSPNKVSIDVPSMHSLASTEYAWSYFYPPVYSEPVELLFGDIENWPGILFPWQRRLKRVEMLAELQRLFEVPSIALVGTQILGGSHSSPAQLADEWVAFSQSLIIRVQRGDTIRAIVRAEVKLADDPFEAEADQRYTAVTLEVWRRARFHSASISPLCFRRPASLYAPYADFLEVLRDRVLARSSVRKDMQFKYHPDGGESWLSELSDPSLWDRAASAWFHALNGIEMAKRDLPHLTSGDAETHAKMRDFAHLAIFEAGARFGWLAKAAESDELMRAEALKHWKRRGAGRSGGQLGAQRRRIDAANWEKAFQNHADEVWCRHPNWSKARVASEVAKLTGRPPNTIRQAIKKS